MQEDLIGEPVELLDEDLDLVAGGHLAVIALHILAAVEQFIHQFQKLGLVNSQATVNVSSVTQVS